MNTESSDKVIIIDSLPPEFIGDAEPPTYEPVIIDKPDHGRPLIDIAAIFDVKVSK